MDRLSSDEQDRYERQLLLPSIGERGQEKMKATRALIVGLGGLGSASSLYLAGAGIGTLGLVDPDVVAASNLHRQIVHGGTTIGMPKVDSARARLADLNEEIAIEVYREHFTTESGSRIAADYDLVVDGTDNFESRYAINDVCLDLGIPYVYGAVSHFEGQVSLLCIERAPCYRCLFPEPPPTAASAETAGILGPVPGTIGALQAIEAIKWIVGVEPHLSGRLLVFDARALRFEEIAVNANPDCPSCNRV